MVNARLQPLYPRERDRVPVVKEVRWAPGPVWKGAENLARIGIGDPDRPGRSESLYGLSYPGSPNQLCSQYKSASNSTPFCEWTPSAQQRKWEVCYPPGKTGFIDSYFMEFELWTFNCVFNADLHLYGNNRYFAACFVWEHQNTHHRAAQFLGSTTVIIIINVAVSGSSVPR